jgi:hypothetical protein
MYLGAKISAQSCLQCFLDVENKKSELYSATRLLLKTHHPNAQAYLDVEKNLPESTRTKVEPIVEKVSEQR